MASVVAGATVPFADNSIASMLADIPGNASRELMSVVAPWPKLSTLARCCPVTGLTTGYAEDTHLKGPALLVARSLRRTPLYLPLHQPGDDLGHVGIYGSSGGGKSTLMALMASSYLRYQDATVTILDKKESAFITTMALGGEHIKLGGCQRGVQPLRHLETPGDFAFAHGWILGALAMRHVETSANVDAAVTEALEALRVEDQDRRTITALRSFIGGSTEVGAALRHYTRDGAAGEIFDYPVQGYGNARTLCLELDEIWESPDGPLAITALFYALKRHRWIGQHPKLVICDEAWAMLAFPLGRALLTSAAREFRKLEAQLVLATQSITDLDLEGAAVIRQQLATTIFLPDAKAANEEFRKRYVEAGLTDDQVDILARLERKGHYMVKTDNFTRVADLRLDGAALAICGANRPADRERARRLLASGVQPGAEFCEAWLSGRDVLRAAA